MTAIEVEVISIDNGVRTVLATIIGTTTPNVLPTNGSGIDGVLDTDIFAPGTVLFCPNDGGKAMVNANGEFVLLG